MSPTKRNLPVHLEPYVVEQRYERYTPEDQAVWRYIMHQLSRFLSQHAHECYIEGLRKTGISLEQIPSIEEMDHRLSDFGWGAVPVSGFIPPAIFMEFQSLGLLPIASDMRSLDHLAYTPAPDIVHEAAGHAPILINPQFATYLKAYAEVARHAIITKKDMDQYAAIRTLSDVKENPTSSAGEIQAAEIHLQEVNRSLTETSEAGWLSRMNWWTAEYGLIGSLKNPRIYGAGLLSSVGESRLCLSSKVRKIPLSLSCIETAYDITEPQPQLFVTPDFETLSEVLEQLAQKMAYRLGGIVGLKRAHQSQSVTTLELDSGLQVSGILNSFTQVKDSLDYFQCVGPVALAVNSRELEDHGRHRHGQGFSSPLGRVVGYDRPLSFASDTDLEGLGVKKHSRARLEWATGLTLEGQVLQWIRNKDRLLLIQFENATLKRGDQILFNPAWGSFDLAVGEQVVRVFGGAADRVKFGLSEEVRPYQVPARQFNQELEMRYKFFSETRKLRQQHSQSLDRLWLDLFKKYFQGLQTQWLPALELLEILKLHHLDHLKAEETKLRLHLETFNTKADVTQCIQDGLQTLECKR